MAFKFTSGKRTSLVPLFAIYSSIYCFYLAIRLPESFDNFWAEDGSWFYNQAINEGFFSHFFDPSAGYYLFINRVVGLIVSAVSPYYASTINALLLVVIQGLLSTLFFETSKPILDSQLLRFLFPILFFSLPIAAFESVGAVTSLHFVLNFFLVISLCRFMIIGHLSHVDSIVISLSVLSGPLALLIAPILFVHLIFFSTKRQRLDSKVGLVLASMLIQIASILYESSRGAREVNSLLTPTKSFYLFFERVFGVNMIPGWNLINATDAKEYGVILLSARLLCLFVVFLSLSTLIFFNARSFLARQDLELIGLLTLCLLVLWFLPSLLFNPEPRYAIAPAGLLIMAYFVLIDRIFGSAAKSTRLRAAICLVVYIFTIISINAQPSELRKEGPSFNSQLTNAKSICKVYREVEVVVRPSRYNLIVTVPCDRL